jgi:glutathione peroxidase
MNRTYCHIMSQVLYQVMLPVFSLFLFSFSVRSQTIYNEGLRDISGNTINLNTYNGKKILFIIAPFKATDSSVTRLKVFANAKDSVQVIGILSFEDGYTSSMREVVKALYQGSKVLLTEACFTRRANAQPPVLQWLTNYNRNGHFNKDVAGIGQLFIVNNQGGLFAVLPPSVAIDSPVVTKLIGK